MLKDRFAGCYDWQLVQNSGETTEGSGGSRLWAGARRGRLETKRFIFAKIHFCQYTINYTQMPNLKY
jgi:hypothetical protein